MAVPAVKFFCEFCGSQVRAGDRICPHCGSFFSQVRCPACGFQGENKLFAEGCPVCGYSASGASAKTPAAKKPAAGSGAGGPSAARRRRGVPPAPSRGESVPPWVLPALVGLFAALAAVAAVMVQGGR